MGFWDGSGINWTISKQSIPHSRQISTPTPHRHWIFLGRMLFRDAQPIVLKFWRQLFLYKIHSFNGPFSGTTRVSWYQKGKTNLVFTEARDSEWWWHQLNHMQVCTSLQSDNHASTHHLVFYRSVALPAAQNCSYIKETWMLSAVFCCLLLVVFSAVDEL